MLLLSSTLLCIYPTSTTLFSVLSKQSVLVLSFEYLTDNSIVTSIVQWRNFEITIEAIIEIIINLLWPVL
jgi:hypothetical protein